MHLGHDVSYHETDRGDAVVISLEGDIDYDRVPNLRMEFDRTHHHRHKAGVIIEMSRVQKIDSSVLGTMLALQRQLANCGLPLVVVPSKRVSEVFSLTQLNSTFKMATDLSDALTNVGVREPVY